MRIELDYKWVLTRIDDAKYPVEVLKDRFVKDKIEKISESYLHLTLAVDENDYEKIKNKISSFFAQKYGKSNLSALSFSDCEPNTDDKSGKTQDKAHSDNSGNTQDPRTIDDTLELVNTLVGAQEFKSLIKELVAIAPEVVKNNAQDVFMSQSYLFSVGDGCGLTTYLEILALAINDLSLAKMTPIAPVNEYKIKMTDKPKDDLNEANDVIGKIENDEASVICFDISKWIDKTDSEDFKKLLKDVQKASENHVIMFRVPFVDKDVLCRIENRSKTWRISRLCLFRPLTAPKRKKLQNATLKNTA